jgi:hypothetical protein
MNKKNIFYIVISIIIGLILGNYIYKGYENEETTVFNETVTQDVYLVQYGVYSTNESMIENTKKLKNYFYYEENNKYYVLIGVIKNKNLKDKIVSAYDIDTEVYLKKEKIMNTTFLESLNQYDSLIEKLDNSNTIINAEKQILSKYEELILRSE